MTTKSIIGLERVDAPGRLQVLGVLLEGLQSALHRRLGRGLALVEQALAHLVGDEEDADPVEGGARGGELGEDVLAVGLFGHHALQTAHLAFDALEPVDDLVGVLLGTLGDGLAHGPQYTVRGIGRKQRAAGGRNARPPPAPPAGQAASVRLAAQGTMVCSAGMHRLLVNAMALGISLSLNSLLAGVQSAFHHYGYLIVFFPILGESAGIPLPGETVLLVGGVAAARGIMSLPLVILVAAAAAIVGDNLGYLVGRRGGRPLLFRYGRLLHVRDHQLAILDSFFERHGGKTVFFGRWVLYLRAWAALFAGASRMHWKTFVFWNALGGIAWATTMGTIAYVFARSVQRLGAVFGAAGWILAILVGITVAIVITRMQRRAENKAQLEAAEERIRHERESWEARREARKAERSAQG